MVSSPPVTALAQKYGLLRRRIIVRVLVAIGVIVVIAASVKFGSRIASDESVSRNSDFPLSFDFESADLCGDFSFNRSFLSNGGNKLNITADENTGLVKADWTGSLLPLSIYFPYSKSCVSGRPPTTNQLEQSSTKETLLCTNSSTSEQPARTTLVISFPPFATYFNNLISADHVGGINLWDLHSHAFPIWLSLRLVEYSASLLPTANISEGGIFPGPVTKPVDLVLLFPDEVWNRLSSETERQPFVLDGTGYKQALDGGAHETPLEGLQGLHDSLWAGGKLVIGTNSSSLDSIQSILRSSGMNDRPLAFYDAPSTEFLWRMALRDITPWTRRCRDSTFYQYAKYLLKSTPARENTDIARNTCYISRQSLVKPQFAFTGRDKETGNLVPELHDKFIQSFKNTIVLNLNVGLRLDNSYPEEHANHSSISGQMKFINEHCGVLVGVHGAGFTHLVALQPGAHIVEFQSAYKYLVYRNLAALSNDITHSVVQFDSVVVSEESRHEANFTLPPNQVERVIKLVNDKLELSISTQEKIRSSATAV